LLGVCYERTYDGEPAMKLEAYASGGDPYSVKIPVEVKRLNGVLVLDTTKIIEAVLDSLNDHKRGRDIAASVQRALAVGLAEIAVDQARAAGTKKVLISGGVSYNESIVKFIRRTIEKNDLKFYTHFQVPPGDGGISLGQSVIAALTLDKKVK